MDMSLIPEEDRGCGEGSGLPPQPSSDWAALSPSRSPPLEGDISCMPDIPPRSPCHRRAHSEITGLSEDLDRGVPGAGDGPSLSDENAEELFSIFLNAEKLNAPLCEASETDSSCAPEGAGGGPRPRPRHQHSHSVDSSTMLEMSMIEAKKAMSNAKLPELALTDPKKAKRIWANRQSAARSKERKMRYIGELERKVQTLHVEATTLSTQLALLQRDTVGLSAENNDLKISLQNMAQQIHLQDALNEALKSELQRLKMATGQMGNNCGGMMMNFCGPPPRSFGGNQPMFHHQNQAAMQQFHQPHPLHAQQPLHPSNMKMERSTSAPIQWDNGWSESSGS